MRTDIIEVVHISPVDLAHFAQLDHLLAGRLILAAQNPDKVFSVSVLGLAAEVRIH